MNQIKIIIFIQVLNSFISGILTIALPLLMTERKIDIVTIGLIFASLPMIFQLTRMSFAVVSDFLGRKLFFVLNGMFAVLSSSIYYLAYTPLQFLLGKVTEGTKDASLWAVNRAFLLESSKEKRKSLVQLRTTTYISMAVGSLLAGFLIVWLFYTNTLILCILIGAAIVPTSLLLVDKRKEKFSVRQALRYLDLRNKQRAFIVFVLLFFVMGLSFGFKEGYVFPLFLSENKFDTETIGIVLGAQILLAGLSSYSFTEKMKIRKLVLLGGLLYSIMLLLLGFSSGLLAAFLIVIYGVVEGLLSVGQEGILLKIVRKESYGTDIGLIMMGWHGGRTISLAASGFLIDLWGYTAPFLLSALIFVIFYTSTYFHLKE